MSSPVRSDRGGARAVQLEPVLVHLQQSVPLHLAQLIGQRAAVHIEIIGQLLAVEGNREALAPAADRLLGEIGQQPPPNGFG